MQNLINVINSIKPFDATEKQHIQEALNWINSGAELYRRIKPSTPPQHLVSYFTLYDANRDKLLFGDHKKSGLLLPPGGHIEPGESPEITAIRECKEELALEPQFYFKDQPLFITICQTQGSPEYIHTDVSLWYLFQGDSKLPIEFD